MKISVIVPTYRGGQKLLDCLDSILDQSRPADEVLVVDSSDDDSPDLVRARFGDRVTLLHQPDRVLAGCARNIGVHAASGDIVAFTDDDCVVDRDWLAELARPYEADPTVAWVTGAIRPYDNKHIVPLIDFWAQFTHWLMKTQGHSVAARAMFNLSFRRDLYVAFSEISPGFGLEDGVFNVRFERAYSRAVVAPKAVVWHRNPLDFQVVLARHRRCGNVSLVARICEPTLYGGFLLSRPWTVPLLPVGREVFFWYRLFRYVPYEGLRLLPYWLSVHRVIWAWYHGLVEAMADSAQFEWGVHDWGTHDGGAAAAQNPGDPS